MHINIVNMKIQQSYDVWAAFVCGQFQSILNYFILFLCSQIFVQAPVIMVKLIWKFIIFITHFKLFLSDAFLHNLLLWFLELETWLMAKFKYFDDKTMKLASDNWIFIRYSFECEIECLKHFVDFISFYGREIIESINKEYDESF